MDREEEPKEERDVLIRGILELRREITKRNKTISTLRRYNKRWKGKYFALKQKVEATKPL